MKTHSTNYANCFISISPDCATLVGTVPPKPDSIAGVQYALISTAPYALTSDDLLVAVTATRKEIDAADVPALRTTLFAKGQPCLRSSPLVKTYGWGVHHDAQSRIALVGVETARYTDLTGDTALNQVLGMRSRRA